MFESDFDTDDIQNTTEFDSDIEQLDISDVDGSISDEIEDGIGETVQLLDENSDLSGELSGQNDISGIEISSSLEEQFAADIESMSFDDLAAEQERLDALSQMDDLDIFAEYDALQRDEHTVELLDSFTDGLSDEIETLGMDELDEMVQNSGVEQVQEVETSTQEIAENSQELFETTQEERERLIGVRDELLELQSEGAVESEDDFDGESPLVLTRDITSEILESRENDTEEVLESYRDNLRGYGVEEEQIEEFISQEREKINAEYESLDRGDTNTQIYEMPNDWASIADSLITQEVQEEQPDELSQVTEIIDDSFEQISEETQEFEINYEEIYEGIQQEALEQGFEGIDIDSDSERLEESLQNFTESNWESLSLDEQKSGMSDLANYVVDIIGFENPPAIEYYNNAQMGDFGGYDASTNTLNVNEYMLYNSEEAADTIAHELWHAHQHECAMHPQSARDYQYQYNFINYIPPDLGQEAYESQLIEAEARAFAAQFKDRLSHIEGRSR